jgi:hypothetical protein
VGSGTETRSVNMSHTHPKPTAAAGPYLRSDELRDLVAAFEATTLPYKQWTHAAHLTVGLWYQLWYGPDEALQHMRTGLRRYNAAHADEPMRVGYHETITRFWMWVVSDYLQRTPVDGSLAELANGLVAACTDRELPFRYYSRDHLMSDAARATWVEPDLRELQEAGGGRRGAGTTRGR